MVHDVRYRFRKTERKKCQKPDTGIDKKHEKTAVLKRKNIFNEYEENNN